MQKFVNVGLAVGMLVSMTFGVLGWRGKGEAETRLRVNVPTSFNPDINEPRVGEGSYIDPLASVIGDVRLGRRVMIAPFASVRGDEGQPIRIGSRTNIQDAVVLHALETYDNGEVTEKNLVEHNGRKYALYIGDEVSLAHQSQVHGPAKVGDRTFIGMQALVFKAEIGEGSVVEPGAKVIGVKVASGHYVPAGAVITTQAQADELPAITPGYAYRTLNDGVIHVNTQLADGYLGNGKAEVAHGPVTKEKGTDARDAAGAAVAASTSSRREPSVAQPTPARATPGATATTRPPLTPAATGTPTSGRPGAAGGGH